MIFEAIKLLKRPRNKSRPEHGIWRFQGRERKVQGRECNFDRLWRGQVDWGETVDNGFGGEDQLWIMLRDSSSSGQEGVEEKEQGRCYGFGPLRRVKCMCVCVCFGFFKIQVKRLPFWEARCFKGKSGLPWWFACLHWVLFLLPDTERMLFWPLCLFEEWEKKARQGRITGCASPV